MHRPGVELATSRSQVRRPTTTLPTVPSHPRYQAESSKSSRTKSQNNVNNNRRRRQQQQQQIEGVNAPFLKNFEGIMSGLSPYRNIAVRFKVRNFECTGLRQDSALRRDRQTGRQTHIHTKAILNIILVLRDPYDSSILT